jgi:flagellar hook-length control protein FliK
VIRPLQRTPDGAYQLRIELRPPELGRVDLRVEFRDGVMHASIHTEHAHTAELVRGALDDLRARLDADGVRSGELTVADRDGGRRERDQPMTPQHDDADAPEAPLPPTATDSDNLLDVRM